MILGIDASRANSTNRTGVERYVFRVIDEWKRLLPNTITVRLYLREAPVADVLNNLPAHWEIHVLQWPPKRLWTHLRLSWEMFRRPPSVLFVPGHVVPLIHPKQTYTTIHDVASLHFPESYNWFERWYTKWAAGFAVRHTSGVFVPSEATKRDIVEMVDAPTAEKKIHVIPLASGYSVPTIATGQQNAVLQELGIHQPFFLYVGRLETKKNLVQIIKAFNLVHKGHDTQLVLAGMPGHGYGAIKAALDDSSARESILLPGFISDQQRDILLQTTTGFVFPTLYEGFGIPILEAFQAGAPVITSDRGAATEVAGEAALLVNPDDRDAIALAMQVLLIDERRRRVLVERGTARASQFSWHNTAAETARTILDTSVVS